MEPAGRYFWQDLKAFLKPQWIRLKQGCALTVRALWGMMGACAIGLAFAICAWRKRKD
jgi:hypothetical protein